MEAFQWAVVEDPPTSWLKFRDNRLTSQLVCMYVQALVRSTGLLTMIQFCFMSIHDFLSVNYIRYEPTALATKNLEISTKIALDKAHTWARIFSRENKNNKMMELTPVNTIGRLFNTKRCQSVTSEIGKLYSLPVIVCRKKSTRYRCCWMIQIRNTISEDKGYLIQKSAATPEIRWSWVVIWDQLKCTW